MAGCWPAPTPRRPRRWRATSGQPAARWAETLERDQWTVPQGLNPLRPLHRIELNDVAGTELYVSARTGEVVRDTTRSERFWNWLGSVPHWIYFTPLRADPPLWHDVVVWLSAACIVSAVTGIAIGILRIRLRRRFRNGSVTPYTGWMAWHHIAGLVGGFFVLTWIVSGWLSMNPNRWFERNPVDAAAMARYTGGDVSTFPWPPATPPAGEDDAAPREVLLQWFDGRPLLQLRDAKARVRVVDAASGAPAAIAREDIVRAAARLRPGATVSEAVLQTAYDFHWYGHHRERVLPVWRLAFDDPARTRLYIDPPTANWPEAATAMRGCGAGSSMPPTASTSLADPVPARVGPGGVAAVDRRRRGLGQRRGDRLAPAAAALAFSHGGARAAPASTFFMKRARHRGSMIQSTFALRCPPGAVPCTSNPVSSTEPRSF